MTAPCPSCQRPTGNDEREWRRGDFAWCEGEMWIRYSPMPNEPDDTMLWLRSGDDDGWRTDAEMTAAGAVLVADVDGPVAARAALAGAVTPQVLEYAVKLAPFGVMSKPAPTPEEAIANLSSGVPFDPEIDVVVQRIKPTEPDEWKPVEVSQ